jgi:hypothetical protein
MPSSEIEEFAMILIKRVRDEAIRSCDRTLRQDAKGPEAKRWKHLIQEGNPEAVVRALIPDIVDAAVCALLRSIDDEVLKLSFTASNEKTCDLNEEGLSELVGWYAGIPGWRSTYSDERFSDDYADAREFIKTWKFGTRPPPDHG